MKQTGESAHVPNDFPRPGPTITALAGAQPKLVVVLDEDGMYRQPGATLGEVLRRYQHCLEVADWGAKLMLEKSHKPKYAEVSQARLLYLFQRTLITKFDLSDAEQSWVRAGVARRLEWVDDLDDQ